ncbi:hypothetical protein Cgig2_009624 [Carnegiea gigantea]|uniref:Reverse transcriptase n=1 Tax=Carnegiea gigantea TaxID=171969 RepID=A0A9Q1JUN5_9CARY|nr:hypothetical protein Cgig2_009624 [Carnegiea gigantea]
MPIDGPFPNHIKFFNEDEVLIRQPVTYEWILTKCSHCAMMGHTEDVCKKKGVIRTEWRKIQKPSTHISPTLNALKLTNQRLIPPTNSKMLAWLTYWKHKSKARSHTACHKKTLPYNVYLWAQLESQRQPLWEALHQISLSTHGAWRLFGDLNTILSKKDRYGGNHVEDHDIQELTNFIANCEVLEMPSSGAFFTWTNKTIWSKIDRVFINSVWHNVFDYTLATVLPPGLSDHSPILTQSHGTSKPPLQFQFYDMWSSDKDFLSIVSKNLPNINSPTIMRLVRVYFVNLRHQLGKLNRSHFNDLKGQQESSRNALI